MWWILFWALSERSTPVAPQSNSSCLEIDHFRKTTPGSVNLEQYFQRNSFKNIFFQKIEWFIRIWMHGLIFILSTFEPCFNVDVPNPVPTSSSFCPSCGVEPRTTVHLFSRLSHPTYLTKEDLWKHSCLELECLFSLSLFDFPPLLLLLNTLLLTGT